MLIVIAPSAKGRLALKFREGERERKCAFPIFLRAYIPCASVVNI